MRAVVDYWKVARVEFSFHPQWQAKLRGTTYAITHDEWKLKIRVAKEEESEVEEDGTDENCAPAKRRRTEVVVASGQEEA
jgi:hypothetical protein